MRRMFSAIWTPAQPIPEHYRRNFIHLYFDIGWFGLLSGSGISFLAIYAARLGASSVQIGLLSAVPSIISMILALPAGSWLEKRKIGRVVFWTSVAQRAFYALFAFFPLLLTIMSRQVQVWVLIVCVLLMSIPATVLGMGFNALFASAAPIEWRGHVAGIRNAVFSLTTVAVSLLCGWILNKSPFPDGYIWVFGLGALGGLMSSVHLWFVKPLEMLDTGGILPVAENTRVQRGVRFDILKGAFGKTLLLLCCFHLAQYLPLPLFSVYSINVLDLSDQTISLGTALFNLTCFMGATQFSRISGRWGNKVITGIGMILLGFYPVLLSFASSASLYLVASIVGGFAWSLAGGAMFNYLLEIVPSNDRPAHLAWYALGSNIAILSGSLIGPILGNWMGLAPALFVFGIIRMITGFTIVRWG